MCICGVCISEGAGHLTVFETHQNFQEVIFGTFVGEPAGSFIPRLFKLTVVNQKLLERIYLDNYSILVGYAYGRTKDQIVANDIVFDAFKKIFPYKPSMDSSQTIKKKLFEYTRQFVNCYNTKDYTNQEAIEYYKSEDFLHDWHLVESEWMDRINRLPGQSESREQIIKIQNEVNEEFIKYYTKHPHKLYHISPRQYEIFVAELLKDMGYEVWLNNHTRDGGRDIIAVLKTPSNDSIVTLVECKKYSLDNPVSIEVVRSFLHTIRDQDKANAGWIVTTSTFSRDAQKYQHNYKWQLTLKDHKDLATLCSNYGKWKRTSEGSGLWLPDNPLE